MSRTLSAAMLTALAAESGYTDVWFIEMTHSGGTLRFTTASENQSWDSNTWTALGGALSFDSPSETAELTGQSYGLSMGGVTQTVISALLNNHFRGYTTILWFGQIVTSTGVTVLDPIEISNGRTNEDWTITEEPNDRGPGSVEIRTTIVSELARAGRPRVVRTNLESHRDMLDRAGRGVTDTFFKRVPEIVGQVIVWGGTRIFRALPRQNGAASGEDTMTILGDREA